MQFDPLAKSGAVEVGQKKVKKGGISEFSDPVGDAQRLQQHTKKPVFSFLDSDCSESESDDSSKPVTKKAAAVQKGGVKKSQSMRPKSTSTSKDKAEGGVKKSQSMRPKSTSTSKDKAASGSRRVKKTEKKKSESSLSTSSMRSLKQSEEAAQKSKDDMMSAFGFNSTTCHFCHKDVGPMIMQCMSCKETYFCQKCLRKGMVAPHQVECAQRKLDEKERKSQARRGVKAHKSMPDLGSSAPVAGDRPKRRKPKKSSSLQVDSTDTTTTLPSKDTETPPQEPDPFEVQHEAVLSDGSPVKSPRKMMGIGKFFGGLGKGKGNKSKEEEDDNNNNIG